MTFVYILLSLLVLTFLIFFHELGHFTVGKLLGFRILLVENVLKDFSKEISND